MNQKIIGRLKKMGITGAFLMCFFESEGALVLFEISGWKPKYALLATTVITSCYTLTIFYTGIAREVTNLLAIFFASCGFNFLSKTFDSSSGNGIGSLTALFLSGAVPAILGGGIFRLAGLFYAAGLESSLAYFIFVAGNIVRLVFFDLIVELAKLCYKKIVILIKYEQG